MRAGWSGQARELTPLQQGELIAVLEERPPESMARLGCEPSTATAQSDAPVEMCLKTPTDTDAINHPVVEVDMGAQVPLAALLAIKGRRRLRFLRLSGRGRWLSEPQPGEPLTGPESVLEPSKYCSQWVSTVAAGEPRRHTDRRP